MGAECRICDAHTAEPTSSAAGSALHGRANSVTLEAMADTALQGGFQ